MSIVDEDPEDSGITIKVKRPKNGHHLLETAAEHEKSREFNPDLNMVMS